MLAAYVSGHGYGHATRTAEVLRAARARAPGLPIAVVSEAPAFLFQREVAPPLAVRPSAIDVGLVQNDALAIDEAASLDAWRTFAEGWDEKVAAEARWLRQEGATLLLGDIPPLAFAAAAAAGVPSIGLANFSWDWVYAHLAGRLPGFGPAAAKAREAYRAAGLLLRLPFAGDLAAFPRIEDIPLVARRPRLERAEARRRLGLDGRPAVLLSFGGLGPPGLRPEAFAGWRDRQVLLTSRPTAGGRPLPTGLRVLEARELEAAGVGYPDLVAAADVVVSKPGYGIVSDCIAARTRLVYTERGDFPEYPVMVSQLERYLPSAHVTNAALAEGRLESALARVLSLPFPEAPALDGASLAARRILERV
jgi:hypothetical protein